MNRIPALFLAATLAGCDGAPVETQALGLEAVPEEVQGVQEGVSEEVANIAMACEVPYVENVPSGYVLLPDAIPSLSCDISSSSGDGCFSLGDGVVLTSKGGVAVEQDKWKELTASLNAICPWY